MTDAPQDAARPTGRRKTPDRRKAPRRADEGAPAPDRRALTVAGPPKGESARAAEASAATAPFAAQLLGQPGAKRGLKGGPEVIDGARSAYLETEYLGRDRRLPKGVIAKRDI